MHDHAARRYRRFERGASGGFGSGWALGRAVIINAALNSTACLRFLCVRTREEGTLGFSHPLRVFSPRLRVSASKFACP